MESSLTSPLSDTKVSTRKTKRQLLLVCIMCGYEVCSKKRLKHHLSKHIQCKGSSPKLESSTKQFTSDNDHDNKYTCTLCNSKYKYKPGLNRHMEKHEDCIYKIYDTRKLSVKKIRHGFSSVKFMMESGKKFESDKPFRCELCGQGCTTKTKLKRHYDIHNSDIRYSCNLCDYSTSRIDTLSTHQKTHTQLKNHTCLKCYKKFKTIKCLKSHVITHASIGKLECPVCLGILPSLSKFKTHLNQHKNDTPPEQLRLPLLMMREKLDELYQSFITDCPGLNTLAKRDRVFPCRSRSYLTSTFLCSICGYLTKKKCNFLVHLLVHGQERPYKCEHCMYSCKSRSNLNKHIKFYHHSNTIRRFTRIPRKISH
ncbi:zinc finger protein 91-like [Biomphalaria glabrata]|uniref:Zinc finger protein 91-like n=1 Tax=Biomphalaria glabrata TaxID=6526 RepID=A0A9W2ZF16_BIOGL|nr:zinc finger protein 91-like [Biomphalaria glabrata]